MKILLAIDDSKFSEAAIQMVVAQGRPQDTEVRVLHVLLPPSLLLGREMGGYDPEFETVWQAEREQAKALVTKITGMLREEIDYDEFRRRGRDARRARES